MCLKNALKKWKGKLRSKAKKKWYVWKDRLLKRVHKIKKITVFSFIDRCKLKTLIWFFIILIFGSASFYYGLFTSNCGLVRTYDIKDPNSAITFFDSLYFSIITVSSLGYGDYRPIGYGRLVSAVEVIFGLVLFSLIVAKLASERQSGLIRLIYSSDIEKRISTFISETNKYSITITSWKEKYLEPTDYIPQIKKLESFIGGICNYLLFQGNKGMIFDIKSDIFLRKLFKALLQFYISIMILTRSSSTPIAIVKVIDRIHRRIVNVAENFRLWSSDPTIITTCESIVNFSACYNDQIQWIDRQLVTTINLSQAVSKKVPSGHLFEIGIEKTIAANLGISVSSVRNCILYLRANSANASATPTSSTTNSTSSVTPATDDSATEANGVAQ